MKSVFLKHTIAFIKGSVEEPFIRLGVLTFNTAFKSTFCLVLTFALAFILTCSLVYLPQAQAEYRAYRLGIKYHPENPDDEEKEVVTTFDHLQYESYYKITPNQQTRIISHWMCRGRTDFHTAYCEDPKLAVENPSQSPTQSPVSSPDIRTPASN